MKKFAIGFLVAVLALSASAQVVTNPVVTGVPAPQSAIDGTPVGATTPSTGAFTTLSASGALTVKAGLVNAPSIIFTGSAATTGIYASGADAIDVSIGGTNTFRFASSGHFIAPTDNTWDIGASGATRPRTGYFATSVITALIDSASGKLGVGTTNSTGANVKGTTTNDSAAAGNVGEYISATCPTASATITVTIASPAIVTWSGNTFAGTGNWTCVMNFTTTGALPTGLVVGTNYYLISSSISGSTFQVATSAANAIAGTAINTTGSQSGTHTGVQNAIMATGTALNLGAVALTAGEWDCDGVSAHKYGTTTSVTNITGGVSATSATLGSFGSNYDWETAANVPTATSDDAWVMPTLRIQNSGTANAYMVSQGTFSVNTMAGYGVIRCRRMR